MIYIHPEPSWSLIKDVFHNLIGGSNWVLARKTPNILARYGTDVICLSNKKYDEAMRLANLSLSNGYD